jgi:glycosyltransferase involved in cell wall biosynthesis
VNRPEVTVIVPTRDRPETLAGCLDALARQSLNGTMETIVVDDGSLRPDKVIAAARCLPGAKVIRGRGLGPAAARNIGVEAARAPVVCFTDDDCRPGREWAARLSASIRAGYEVTAGRTLAAPAASHMAIASQLVANHLAESTRQAGAMTFAPSNNIACRASLLAELPFDTTYPAAGGEDRDWCARVVAAGHRMALDPAATVVHDARLTVRGYLHQHFSYGRGAHRFRRAHRSAGWSEPARFYVELLRKGLNCGPRVAVLIALAQVATAAGRAWERLS